MIKLTQYAYVLDVLYITFILGASMSETNLLPHRLPFFLSKCAFCKTTVNMEYELTSQIKRNSIATCTYIVEAIFIYFTKNYDYVTSTECQLSLSKRKEP